MPEIEEVSEGEDFLEGICEFPASVNNRPSKIVIANPNMTIDDLIQSVFVKGVDGVITEVKYGLPVEGKIVGFRKDMMALAELENTFGDQGIVFSSPANPTGSMTLAEWKAKYGTDFFLRKHISILMNVFHLGGYEYGIYTTRRDFQRWSRNVWVR